MALFNIDFHSNVLALNTSMQVIIPQKTTNSIGATDKVDDKKLKTLYLLHGFSDNQSGWTRYTTIETFARTLGIAVVIPFVHNSWYANMKYGFDYFEFISKELPQICREFFPQLSTDPKDNFLLGNSMGGYGALKLGLTMPETFGYIGAFSGAFDIEDMYKMRSVGTPKLWQAVFGDLEEIKNSENDAFYLANKYATKKGKYHIYMWCGKDDFLYHHSQKMSKTLKDLGYDVTYKTGEGSHCWISWQNQIQGYFDWLKSQNAL